MKVHGMALTIEELFQKKMISRFEKPESHKNSRRMPFSVMMSELEMQSKLEIRN